MEAKHGAKSRYCSLQKKRGKTKKPFTSRTLRAENPKEKFTIDRTPILRKKEIAIERIPQYVSIPCLNLVSHSIPVVRKQ